MGLGNSQNEAADDDGGGGCGCDGGKYDESFGSVSCSICLEVVVVDSGDRSWAKLQCGHQFHLDCIGSAFNVKGVMQCPNCRKIEKGQWLYANGGRSLPEFSMDDWAHDDDFYDLGYTEMSFGVHWCPFGNLARPPSSFDEGEFPSNAYPDILRQHAIFAEHSAAVSSATHPCPYVAYFGPIHHPSSSNSSANVSDGSNFNNHWNGPSVPGEIPSSYAFPTMDLNYHSWEHQSPPFSIPSSRVASADQPLIQSTGQRSVRTSSEIPRSGSFLHPFLVGHSSNPRARSSVASPAISPYQGSNARARDRVQALQAYYQQQQPGNSQAIRTPIMTATRRTSTHRSPAQVATVASSSDQTGFYFIPSGSSGRNFPDADSIPPTRFRAWERDHPQSFSSTPAERDSGWGAFHHGAGGSDSGIRSSSSFRQRHGSERVQS